MTPPVIRLAAAVLALGTVAGCASSAPPGASAPTATSGAAPVTTSGAAAPGTTGVTTTTAGPAPTDATSGSTAAGTTVAPAAVPVARRWVELVETIVRADKPGPPTSARLYAYVTASYADARAAAAPDAASAVVRNVLRELAPAHRNEIDALARALGAPDEVPATIADVAATYVERARTDGWTRGDPDAALATEPTGPGHWVRVGGLGPLDATAGSWRRWLVDGATFSVPEPPAFGTDAYAEQQRIVAAAVRRRDAHWQQVIEFWGGAPGTQAPAGIWLDRLWSVARTGALATDDLALARAQSALARTVADAFMECWKVKFTYWTARPSMADPSISLAMANPAFPGYVSGHSTVSAAAASVLSMLLPEQRDEWWREAAEARDSRLIAGIHFEIDNTAGFQLGTDVGAAAVARLPRGG